MAHLTKSIKKTIAATITHPRDAVRVPLPSNSGGERRWAP